jgi:hypothetical protein
MACLPHLRRSALLGAATVVVCLGCSSGVEPGTGSGEPLHTAVSATIDSSALRTLVATLSVANRSQVAQTIDWSDDCAGNGGVDVEILQNAVVVWSSPLAAPHVGCPTQQIESTIAPGLTVQFQRQIELRELLGDSIAAGPYEVIMTPTVTSAESPSLNRPIDAGQLTLADPVVVSPGVSLDGTWSASGTGLAVNLTMHWRADSVFGVGTYTAEPSGLFTCGGGTIAGATGPLQLVASRIDDFIRGRLVFSGGDGPPLSGHLRSADSLDVEVTTIDTSGCRLELLRTGP